MPLFDSHKLLFVHIPHSGGTSIESKFKVIREHNENAAYSFHQRKINGIYFAPQHYTPKMLQHFYPERFKTYKKFTIARNPYTKCISTFFYHTKKENCNEQYFKKHFHFWCEKYYLVDKVDLPQAAYFENITYDYVLRTESLAADYKRMAAELKMDGNLGIHNKSKTGLPSTSYIKYIEPPTIDFINTFFKKDFELLKYPMLPGILTGK